MMTRSTQFFTQSVRNALGFGPGRVVSAGAAKPADTGSSALVSAAALDAPPNDDDRSSEPAGAFDPGVVDVLAEKVLLAWLRNRHQLLFPFTLDLRRLNPVQAEVFRDAIVAAALADGAVDAQERGRIEGALGLINPRSDARAALEAALSHPKCLNEVLAQVRDVQTGALVYAASLTALDQRKPVNRHYLKYLAVRLQLSEELAASLEQRFHAAG